VWGYDPETEEWSLRRVIETHEHDFDGTIVAITVGKDTVEATGTNYEGRMTKV
jgi:hypothetical protein